MEKQRHTVHTISDVARLAGVSITTVSRVLNHNENVSKVTKKKVMKIIQELDYIPNELARGLATSSSNSIGILIPDILNTYYTELIKSIENKVSAKGFSLLLCITNSDPKKEEYYMKEMLKKRVCGLIFLSTSVSKETLEKVYVNGMKLVAVDADIEKVDRLCVENQEGTYQVVKHLLDLGHRKIAFLGYQFELSSLQNRVEGYKRALKEYGVPINEDYILEGNKIENVGYDLTKKVLQLFEPPTAIHCMNEYIATGVYLALDDMGKKIPEDISVTAFDGLLSSKILRPKLTTAQMPIKEMGEMTADLIINSIEQESQGSKKTITFPTKLYLGTSARTFS